MLRRSASRAAPTSAEISEPAGPPSRVDRRLPSSMFSRLKLRRPSGPLLAAAKGAIQRTFRTLSDFSGRVYNKAGADDIFFLAGGIAFNVMLAALPFLL